MLCRVMLMYDAIKLKIQICALVGVGFKIRQIAISTTTVAVILMAGLGTKGCKVLKVGCLHLKPIPNKTKIRVKERGRVNRNKTER